MQTENSSNIGDLSSPKSKKTHWFWRFWHIFCFFILFVTFFVVLSALSKTYNPFSFCSILLVAAPWNIFIYLAFAELINTIKIFADKFIEARKNKTGVWKSIYLALTDHEFIANFCLCAGSCFALAAIFASFTIPLAPIFFTIGFCVSIWKILFVESLKEELSIKSFIRIMGNIIGLLCGLGTILFGIFPPIVLITGAIILFVMLSLVAIFLIKNTPSPVANATSQPVEYTRNELYTDQAPTDELQHQQLTNNPLASIGNDASPNGNQFWSVSSSPNLASNSLSQVDIIGKLDVSQLDNGNTQASYLSQAGNILFSQTPEPSPRHQNNAIGEQYYDRSNSPDPGIFSRSADDANDHILSSYPFEASPPSSIPRVLPEVAKIATPIPYTPALIPTNDDDAETDSAKSPPRESLRKLSDDSSSSSSFSSPGSESKSHGGVSCIIS